MLMTDSWSSSKLFRTHVNKSFPFSALFLCPVRCLSVPFVASPFRSFRFHNGSRFRDSVPLRRGFHRRVLSAGLLCGLVLPSRFHNGSRFRDSVPLRHGFLRGILSTGLLHGIAPPSRFHNGRKFRDSVPLRNRITASRAPCISVFPAAARFPPSEGVQYSRIFVSPSEGAWTHHSFESALCPCFSSRLAFPTFRRCAGFPRFRLTFRRCAVSGAADATILKRPDALCRKTSIAITRILVFLPLLNRK